jgi:hypothetical protein
MTKQFTFNDYSRNIDAIFKFVQTLVHYSNSQTIINTRFQTLLNRLSAEASEKDSNSNNNNNNVTHSGEISDSRTRRAYFSPDELKLELVEAGFDRFMKVKLGCMDVIPNKFIVEKYKI